MKRQVAVLLSAMIASAAAMADEQTLKVTLNGIEHDNGSVNVALFADDKSFRKADQAFATHQEPARKGSMTLVFDNVPAGNYAVMAYHDENGNGKLDLRLGMFPIEGYGLSNNPKVMGPPSFKASEFQVNADQPLEISIDLNY